MDTEKTIALKQAKAQLMVYMKEKVRVGDKMIRGRVESVVLRKNASYHMEVKGKPMIAS